MSVWGTKTDSAKVIEITDIRYVIGEWSVSKIWHNIKQKEMKYSLLNIA